MFLFKKSYLIYISIFVVLLSLILFPKYTFEAATEGLLLWANIIVPSLLPFIIVSNLIIHLNLVKYISFFFKPIMRVFFNLPSVAGYAWVLGMLSGYPMGAKITGDLLHQKLITPIQGQFLLTFVNNVSPMFVLGFVSTGILDVNTQIGFLLLFILYLSSLITGFIFRFVYGIVYSPNFEKHNYTLVQSKKSFLEIFDQCIVDAIDLIIRIGGYVIFFSIIVCLAQAIPFQSLLFKNFFLGIIEISNGISLISNSPTALETKIVLINTIIGFGGFSVHGQTASVLQNTNLSIPKYIFAKSINGFITFVLTLLFFLFTAI
ncbi:sporulation integral membrane protein YlbJ [Natranaerovirga hydrolytica]|uniref:Sporulation integral membrane protein YlbJ n=1 Tax=Natranaerovirga hydrolytica TaxID=680378 RepID=A0A4R1N0A3_9FIRM|nr:hypothetical protein [Natranaerovirga hydrolytica]TCK98320.1 sporulation integral membrane protein YlbJ [Natranaerovirga hydrolytica]